MWQEILVGVIVVFAVLYALWYWMPASLRKRLGRVQPALAKAPSCGACSDCGGCATPRSAVGMQAAAPPPAQQKGRSPL